MINIAPYVMPTLRLAGQLSKPVVRFAAPPLAYGARAGLIGIAALGTSYGIVFFAEAIRRRLISSYPNDLPVDCHDGSDHFPPNLDDTTAQPLFTDPASVPA